MDISRRIKTSKAIFLISFLLIAIYSPSYSESPSSDGNNPFNQFINPQGGVSLFSGDVVFPYPLVTLPGLNGMNVNVSLSYSSNVNKNVRTRNDKAPTSWVGLGWRLGYGSIVCNHNGTRVDIDDDYMWLSPEGVGQKILRNSTGVFYLEKSPYWKVKRIPETLNSANKYIIEGWELTDPTGKKYIYGAPSQYGWATDNNAVRNTFCWEKFEGYDHPEEDGGYVGEGTGGTIDQMYQINNQWDIVAIVDIYGNRVEFEYETVPRKLKSGIWDSPYTYTQASYLRKIINPQGDYIRFYTSEKDPLEYLDPKRYHEEPDAHMEFYETKALDSITIFTKGHFSQKFVFCYDFINLFRRKHYKKRLITSIATISSDRKEKDRVKFKYIGLNESDPNPYSEENTGALYKIETPRCGIIEYKYKKYELNTTELTHSNTIYHDYSSIKGNIVENGKEYFVAFKSSSVNSDKDRKDLHIFTWIGNKWKAQVIELDDFAEREVFCGHECIFIVNNEDDFFYVLEAVLFWDKPSRSWVNATYKPSFNYTVDQLYINNNFYVFTNNDFGTFRGVIDRENRTIGEDELLFGANYKLGGLDPFYLYQYIPEEPNWPDDYDKIVIATFCENGEIVTKTIHYDPHDIIGIGAGRNFFVVIHDPGRKEKLQIFRWNGREWVLNEESTISCNVSWNDIRIKTGNDFFTVNILPYDHLKYYWWNGEHWSSSKQKNKGSCDFHIETGKDFFILRQYELISNQCSNKRRKERFYIYTRDKNNWTKSIMNKMGLGERIEKQFDAGNNFYVALRRTKNRMRHPADKLRVAVKIYDGEIWRVPERVFTIDTKPDGSRVYNPSIHAVKDAFAAKMRVDIGDTDTPHCGYNEFDQERHKYTRLYLAKKINDSFFKKPYYYVVSEKKTYDGITNKPVVTHFSYHPADLFYDSETGSAMFRKVTLLSEDNSSKQVFYYNNYNSQLFGQVDKVETYANYADGGQATPQWKNTSTKELEYIDDFKKAEWPEIIRHPRLISVKEEREGLKTEVINEYNDDNGLVAKTLSTGNDDKIKKVENKFVFDNDDIVDPTIKIAFTDANMISQKSQTIIADSLKGDENDAKSVASEVTTWRFEEQCNAYVPDASYVWKVMFDDDGNLIPPGTKPDFDYENPDNQEYWQKNSKLSKYATIGTPLEIRDGSSFYDGEGTPGSAFIGHNGILTIAEVKNAEHDECGFLTGDYDNYETDGTDDYFDLENGWKKGGSVLVEPEKKHFGDSVIHVDGGNEGPTKEIWKIDKYKDYTFSAWVYPITDPYKHPIILGVYKKNEDGDISEASDHMKRNLIRNRWNFVSRTIKKELLQDFEMDDYLTIKVSSGVMSADFYVEDIRFHPKNTLPATTFYDSLNKVVCIVDGYNNHSNTEYDSWGRTIKQFLRNVDGTVDTVLTENEYHCMACKGDVLSSLLAHLGIMVPHSEVSLINFDPNIFTYDISVQNNISEFTLEASAKDPYAFIEIYKDGILVFDTECPCGVSEQYTLDDVDVTVTYTVKVIPERGIAPQEYYINFVRLSNCWIYSGNSDITDGIAEPDILTVVSDGGSEEFPCLAYRESGSGNAIVKYNNSGIWEMVGSGGGSPAFSGDAGTIGFVTDNTKMFIAYSDPDNGTNPGTITVKEMDGVGGTWTLLGTGLSASEPGMISLATHSSNLYMAYIADKYEELGTTPPVGVFEQPQIFIKIWNGSSWSDLPARPDLEEQNPVVDVYGSTNFMELKVSSSGQLYIAYIQKNIFTNEDEDDPNEEYNHGKVFVVKYDGTPDAEKWDKVENAPVSDGKVSQVSFSINSEDLYVAYSEELPSEEKTFFDKWYNENKVVVKKFNDPAWEFIKDETVTDPAIFYSNGNEEFGLNFFENKPFLSFTSMYNEDAVSAIEYDASNYWLTFRNPSFALSYSGENNDVNVEVDNNDIPYVSFGDHINNTISVMEWNDADYCGDANIKDLTVQAGGIDVELFPKEFKQYLTHYAAKIDQSYGTIDIIVTTRTTVSSVFIGGVLASNTGGNIWQVQNFTVNVEDNEIPIVVTSSAAQNEDAASATYYLNINRPPSSCAALCYFELYDVNLIPITYTPDFEPINVFNYTATVPSTTDMVVIKPTTDGGSSITINGIDNPSGYYSAPIPLKYGKNIITFSVLSPDEQVNFAYTLTITRKGDSDIMLSGLNINSTPITISDDSFDYTVTFDNTVQDITVTANFTSPPMDVFLDFASNDNMQIQPNTQTQPMNIGEGSNYLSLLSINANNGKEAEYNVNVIRTPLTCLLNEFKIWFNGQDLLSGLFSPGILRYDLQAGTEDDKVTIEVKANFTDIEIFVENDGTTIGQFSPGASDVGGTIPDIEIYPGKNNFKVILEKDNGLEVVYLVEIFKALDPPVPSVYFEKGGSSVLESIGSTHDNTHTLKVILSDAPFEQVVINYAHTGGMAQPVGISKDYMLGNGTLTFEICEVEKEIELVIIDDDVIEGDETAEITLSIGSGNATLGGTVTHTMTIIDDDFPKVSFDQKSTDVIEDTEGAENIIEIGVSIDPPPPIEVDAYFNLYHTSYGLTDEDYELLGDNKAVFSNTSVTDAFQVKIFGDLKIESDEYFILQLLPAPGVEIDPYNDKHKVTILNDDSPIIYVDFTRTDGRNNGSSWDDAFLKLQDALDFARDHTDLAREIHVSEGNYFPDEGANVTDDDRDASFELVEGVLLKGGFTSGAGDVVWDPEAYVTTLDGDIDHNDNADKDLYVPERNNQNNSKHVVTCLASTTIEGIKIYGGYAEDVGSYGSAILADGRVILKKCRITDNYSYNWGNVYMPQSIEDCYFENNRIWDPSVRNGWEGGTIYNVSVSNPLKKVEDCIFKSNWGHNGCAIYIEQGNEELIIKGCKFENHTSNGSVVYIKGNEGGTRLINCKFLSNEGIGVWFNSSVNDEIRLANCVFFDNGFDYSVTYSGGVTIPYSKGFFEFCTFVQNKGGRGGAIKCGISDDTKVHGNMIIDNCIFWNNEDIDGVDGTHHDFFFPKESEATLSINKCNIKLDNLYNFGVNYRNNISVDPVFESINQSDQNFLELASTSPCINIGDKSVLWSIPYIDDKDLAGNARIQQEEVDLGAYESSHSGYNRVINFVLRTETFDECSQTEYVIDVVISKEITEAGQNITVPFTIPIFGPANDEATLDDFWDLIPGNKQLIFLRYMKKQEIKYKDFNDGQNTNESPEKLRFKLGEPSPTGSAIIGGPAEYMRIIWDQPSQ